MAGLVRGIVARRRRVHHTNNNDTNTICSSSSANISSFLSSRRYAFSLFSNYSSDASFLGQRRSRTYRDDEMWKLGALAREAKDRLDAKLRSQPTSIIRNINDIKDEEETRMNSNIIVKKQVLRREVFGRKKNGKAKKLMSKLVWNYICKTHTEEDQQQLEECAVCLTEFKVGDDILNLPCAHTFHSTCLMPWLHNNAHCPCCRLSIF